MTAKTYIVRRIAIQLGDETFPEGSEIELDDETAAGLKRFLEPVAKPGKQSSNPAKTAQDGKLTPPPASTTTQDQQ